MTTDALVAERKPQGVTALGIIDSDIHPSPRDGNALNPYLPAKWREHLAVYGDPQNGPYASRYAYPRYSPETSRRDAWPPGGGLPGSDVEFMRAQHLDKNNVAIGILEPLQFGNITRNVELGASMCGAINEWQLAEFVSREPRLRASIVVPQDDARASVAEIEKRAPDMSYAQIQMPSITSEPIGRKRYWPIFEAAERHAFPIGIHVGGPTGARTGGGWPSYYNEEHFALTSSMQTQLTSLVLEGVFEHFPKLKFIMIEGGCAWAPSLSRRLDKLWQRMGSEVPYLKKAPSEYIKNHFFFSTQPVEEPEDPNDLNHLYDEIGWDRMVFASDYPHWDFDDPKYAFKGNISDDKKRMVLRDNALGVYRLGR